MQTVCKRNIPSANWSKFLYIFCRHHFNIETKWDFCVKSFSLISWRIIIFASLGLKYVMQLGWDGSKIATSLHPVLSRSFKSMLLSSNPWCFWLWSLVMSLVCFDPTIICHSWRVVWVKVTLWLPSQLNLPIRSISRVKYHQLTQYNSILLYKDDYQLGCRNISHCQQQSYSGLRSSGWSDSCIVNH